MNKIITTILLLVFCINPICFATEIIVGLDGQARYSDGTVTPVKKEIVKKEAATPKVSIETKAELEKIIKPYENKNIAIIKKANQKIDYQKALTKAQDADYRFGERSYYSKSMTIPLQDGDYVTWNKTARNLQYATEFHKDDSPMGVVEIKKINKKTVVFYEYRSEVPSSQTATLKHIMIAYNDNNKAAFIYDKNYKLRCCQYQGQTYAIDLPNMPEISPVELGKIETAGDQIRSNTGEVLKTGGMAIATLPVIVLAAPVFLIALLTWDGSH